MPRPTVFITRKIPDEGIKLLKKEKFRVIVAPQDKPISRRDLLHGVKNADAVISILTDQIDGSVFDAARQAKIFANYAVGFNNIDLEAAADRNIIVTNAPAPQVSESVAEHTIALMFALAHRIVETDKFTRAGKYKAWGPELLLGTDLFGKTIGIIGLGRIGKAVAQRLAEGFNMKIMYHNRSRDKQFEKEVGAKYGSMKAVLQKSDFISLHVPLTPDTYHLISTPELKLMKKTAFLINTARGPVIDEKALVKALAKNKIAGAGLDVYECEPMIDCDPTDNYELRKLDNVVLTPHTASATIETRQAMSVLAAKNVIAVLKGRKPITPVKSL
jgi:glyoxylate reductase